MTQELSSVQAAAGATAQRGHGSRHSGQGATTLFAQLLQAASTAAPDTALPATEIDDAETAPALGQSGDAVTLLPDPAWITCFATAPIPNIKPTPGTTSEADIGHTLEPVTALPSPPDYAKPTLSRGAPTSRADGSNPKAQPAPPASPEQVKVQPAGQPVQQVGSPNELNLVLASSQARREISGPHVAPAMVGPAPSVSETAALQAPTAQGLPAAKESLHTRTAESSSASLPTPTAASGPDVHSVLPPPGAVPEQGASPADASVENKLAYWGSQGVHTGELRLNDEMFETLHIRVRMEGSEAQVSFATDQPEPRDIIANSTDHLHDMLGQTGIQLTQVSVSPSATHMGSDSQQHGQHPATPQPAPLPNPGPGAERRAGRNTPGPTSPARSRPSPGRIDLFV